MIIDDEMLCRIYGSRAVWLVDYYTKPAWRGQRAFRCKPWRLPPKY